MNKKTFIEYLDKKDEIPELQRRIRDLERRLHKIEKETVRDTVSGGEGGIQHFVVEGVPNSEITRLRARLKRKRDELQVITKQLKEETDEVEDYLDSMSDLRMRRILRMKYLEDLTWNKVAMHIGRRCTADSCRMQVERFLKEGEKDEGRKSD